ncbi:MAG TPA: MgtC/SapB family protein [Nitrososphaeria archaeon]|nr:MAG: MgtC/SapB family protein [Nitrososphaerota archaeon]HDJ66109.1 MgtC/SapB family protein [Nitrososphaeria archaeon]
MDTFSQLDFLLRIILAFALSGIIGFERERVDKPAGLRTHILVGVGSCLFTILSFTAFPGSDPARVASYVVAGIGFIGAGTILQTKERVLGITTAASLWVAAAIGMATGVGYYLLAVLVTALSYLTLRLRPLEEKIKMSERIS